MYRNRMESQNETNNKGKNTFDKGNTTNIPTFAAIKHQIHKSDILLP